ncbi:MAG: MBL fold metallo-hydrolase [Motiliproteus sp.]
MADSWQILAQFYAPLPDQYIELKEGERISIGGDDWRMIVTKGHSPAHVCFYNEQRQLLISGDQVLPLISSNVSAIAHRPEENPLKDWLEGLGRLSDLPANTLVLPAHNYPFHGLQRRVQDLVDEHQALLDRILSLLQQPMTVRQLSLLLYPRAIQGLDLSLANGETLAHLRYLVEQQSVCQMLNDKGQLLFARA